MDTVVPAEGKVLVPTDLALAVPKGAYGRLAPRSGLAAKHFLSAGAGVVDPDYRGNVQVLLFNHSKEHYQVKRGERIAQLLLECVVTPEVIEEVDLSPTTRGENGFGSTGVSSTPTVLLQQLEAIAAGSKAPLSPPEGQHPPSLPLANPSQQTGTTAKQPKSEPSFKFLAVLADVEAEEVTETERKAIAQLSEHKLKSKKRRKLSPRRLVEMQLDLKTIDHEVCGQARRQAPIPPAVQKLNKEYAHLFQEKLPPGLPPSRSTDHRIDLKEGYRVPAAVQNGTA